MARTLRGTARVPADRPDDEANSTTSRLGYSPLRFSTGGHARDNKVAGNRVVFVPCHRSSNSSLYTAALTARLNQRVVYRSPSNGCSPFLC